MLTGSEGDGKEVSRVYVKEKGDGVDMNPGLVFNLAGSLLTFGLDDQEKRLETERVDWGHKSKMQIEKAVGRKESSVVAKMDPRNNNWQGGKIGSAMGITDSVLMGADIVKYIRMAVMENH